MAIKLGTSDISKVYLGATEVAKIYLGATEVYSSGFDADYQDVLDYATSQGYTLPSASQQTIQNNLVESLKTEGFWSRLDSLGMFATNGDSDFALIDWKRLSGMSGVNAPAFTTNVGFQGDGSTSYINTNFNPSTDASNYTQNNAGISIYQTIVNGFMAGTSSFSDGEVRLRTDGQGIQINGSIDRTANVVTTQVGNSHFDRISSTQIVDQMNSTLGTVRTNASTGVPQNDIWVLRLTSFESSGQVSFFCARNSFTESEKNTLNGIIDTYLAAI